MSDQDLATMRVSLEMSRHRNIRLTERLYEAQQDARDLRAEVQHLRQQVRTLEKELARRD